MTALVARPGVMPVIYLHVVAGSKGDGNRCRSKACIYGNIIVLHIFCRLGFALVSPLRRPPCSFSFPMSLPPSTLHVSTGSDHITKVFTRLERCNNCWISVMNLTKRHY